ncbi:MAG TPA: ABC transporter permease [Acidimicrobiales bacterium]|nr:ABC transporter permease [Acidimicrobiales bacterium]
MTVISIPTSGRAEHRAVGRLPAALSDGLDLAGRYLVHLYRLPQLLVFSTIQPVLFVLLFRYAFGGAIRIEGANYVDFLMPGIFAQTVAFGAIGAAVGLATDLNTGLLERFRSLPMARSAVLAGRTGPTSYATSSWSPSW